ncbi:MAG: glutamate 5-kinase [Pirellulales bacterium]
MTDILRQEIATSADRLVVKVGSRVLTREDGTLNTERVAGLAEQLVALARLGRRVALVSSGAVAAGMGRIGLRRRPTNLAELQAIAAVGQSHLIVAYDNAPRRHGYHVAQLLLTTDDLNDRTRYLNVRNTVVALFAHPAIPILNENDTVSVEELQISFGDNDRLAAMVTNLIRAPLLVLLSDVDGLYDGDPADPDSRLIDTVPQLDASVLDLARDTGDGPGKGGMASKLRAAEIATAAGENVIIANGHRSDVLTDIVAGKRVGTLILAHGPVVTSWKRWIGFTAQPRGQLKLDAGACRAIRFEGRSLLAIGIVDTVGEFGKGDVVTLVSEEGIEFARGLTNYAAAEIRQIGGLRTDAIAQVLGHCPYDEVIHRDNLLVSHATADPTSRPEG